MIFNKKEVSQIRQMYMEGMSVQKLLKQFRKASQSTLYSIVSNRTYRDDIYAEELARFNTPIDVKFIKELRARNFTLDEIKDLEQKHSRRPYAFSYETIRQYLNHEENNNEQKKEKRRCA